MADDKAKDKKIKKPSALKRDIQGEKNRLRNRSYRSSVLTAVRSFETSLSQKEPKEAVQTKLNEIYSLMDRGVKKGIYKPNKASRTKARLTARVVSL